MRACIPTHDATGREARVFGHFGSAPCFTIVDTATGDLTILENRNAHHAHGTCHPMSQLEGRNVDAVVVGGIGRRALQHLQQAGLKVYRPTVPTVGGIIDALEKGELPEMEIAHACGGHAHSHGHGHGSRSHCSR